MNETKEWMNVKHSPTITTVTCTMMEGNLTVKWTVKTYVGQIKRGVAEARAGARKAMDDLQFALRLEKA